jgi:O-antigen/teichoic acid export membrane protein
MNDFEPSKKLKLRKLNHVYQSVQNISIRGCSISSRFLLSLYIAKFMGLGDIGRFGLVMGIVGFMPSIVGFGLNYFLSREIIDAPIPQAGRRIRDRLVVTSIMCILVVLIFSALYAENIVEKFGLPFKVIFIVILEVFALDIHMCLIGLRMPIFASVLLLVRSASWVFVFIGLSYYHTGLRSLSFLFDLWLIGLFLNYFVLFSRFYKWPWTEIMLQPVDIVWLRNVIGGGLLIFASDIAIAGAMNIDRFVVNYQEGITLTGIYMFFWSIAASSQALISSSIIQVALPRIVSAFRNDGELAWRNIMIQEATKVLFAGTFLAIVSFFLVKALLPYIHRTELEKYLWLFAVMLLASVIRMLSDVMNYGLYSRGKDKYFAITNILGTMISPFLTIVALARYGLNGVGLSMLLISISLLSVRSLILTRLHFNIEREV